jgi:hypothetical protein
MQLSKLFPRYRHFLEMTPVASVRPKYRQPATFLSTLPIIVGDGPHETTPDPKTRHENKSAPNSQYVHVSYTQAFDERGGESEIALNGSNSVLP